MANARPRPLKIPARLLRDTQGQQRWADEVSLLTSNLNQMRDNIQSMRDVLDSGTLKGTDEATRQRRIEYVKAINEHEKEIRRQEKMLDYVKSGTPLAAVQNATSPEEFSSAVARWQREEQARVRSLPIEERPESEQERDKRVAQEALDRAAKRSQDAFPELLRKYNGRWDQARVAALRLAEVRPEDLEAGEGETQEVEDEHA